MNRELKEIEAHGARLAFIGQATPRHAAHFQRRYAPDVEIYADEDRATYKALGLRRGSAAQLIGPKSVLKGIARAASGTPQGRIIGDAAQLGGTLLVLQDGTIAWEHRSTDASDNPSVEDVTSALTDVLG